MKNYTHHQREGISRECLVRAERWIINNPIYNPGKDELLSYAGYLIAKWFYETNWRPYENDKGTTIVTWVSLVVSYGIRDYVRKVTGARRVHSLPTVFSADWSPRRGEAPEGYIEEPVEKQDFYREVELADQAEWVLGKCTKAQRKIVEEMLKGHSKRSAGLVLGQDESNGYHTIQCLRRRLHGN